MSEFDRKSDTPPKSSEGTPTTSSHQHKTIDSHRDSFRGKFRLVLTTFGAVAALVNGGKSDGDGHSSCSGCHVCSPPPIVKKDKEDEDEGEGDEDNT